MDDLTSSSSRSFAGSMKMAKEDVVELELKVQHSIDSNAGMDAPSSPGKRRTLTERPSAFSLFTSLILETNGR